MDLTDCYLSIAIDTDSNVYVAYWNNATTLGQTYVGGTYDVVITKISNNNVVQWTVHQPSYNTSGYGWQPNIAVDSVQNVYVTFPTPGTMAGQVKTGDFDVVVMKLDANGTFLWVSQQPDFNTTGNNTYPVIATDYASNLYVSYRTDGQVTGGTPTGGQDIAVFKLDTDGNFDWIVQNPTFNTDHDDTQPTIAIDQYGAVYVAYWTEGGTASGQTNTGGNDIVVFKLDTHGETQWVQQNNSFNTYGDNEIPAIAVDKNQNAYVAFVTDGTASGQTNTGDSDIVVFKLDIYGNTIWVQQQPTFNTVQYDDYPTIAIDTGGSAYIAYTTTGVTSGQTFTGWTFDVVIFKLSINGYTQWVQQAPGFNTKGENINPAICIDTKGSIFMVYPTDGTIGHMPVSGPYDIVACKILTSIEKRPIITCDDAYLYYLYYTNEGKAEDQFTMVIVKKDFAGNTIWVRSDPAYNKVSSRNPTIVACVISFFYVVFQTAGETEPGQSLFPFDIVVMKLDSDGNIIWIKQNRTFNTTRSDEYPSADVDNDGNVYVAYQTTGRVVGGFRSALSDRYDIVVFKMDPNGTVLWVRQSKYFNSERGGRNPFVRVDHFRNAVYIVYSSDGRVYYQEIAGDSDVVIFKLNADTGAIVPRGTSLWVLQNQTFNTATFDENPTICIDNLGYIYLCYSTSPGGYATHLSSWGGFDIIMCKFDANGNVVKLIQSPVFDTSGDETNPRMTYRSGYLYVTYQTTGAVSGQSHTGQNDIVCMKVNTVTMDVIWIRENSKFNTIMNDTSPSVTTDSLGNCYFAFETTGIFYNQPFGNAYQAVMVCRLNSTGSFAWVKR